MSGSPDDYLNPTEKRELAEITDDLTSLRKARSELNRRKATIKARAAKRLSDAEMRLRRELEAIDCRRVIL